MRKSTVVMALLISVSLSLTACDGKSKKAEQSNQSEKLDSDNTKEADFTTFQSILTDIYHAEPGTAGCSLKSAKAAGELLDWLEDNIALTDKEALQETTTDWYDTNSKTLTEIETMSDAWQSVLSDANSIISDRDNITPILSDAVYTLQHDTYTQDNLDMINEIFTNVFSTK